MTRKPEPRGAFLQLVADLANFRSQRQPMVLLPRASKVAQLKQSIGRHTKSK